ncbi:hypothetical protein HIM_08608 [Hirsutella minnesotensis 3608]|uniref:Uncharacterized protein n=1 Tax=Hirsutella minnesotensis 3608 TaxID=1043627 RepID=A0A0F7ZY88_9HYPO|nr:hypothetical protein HIM_08608 [Hirsutella minnesotensis 3608]
MAQPAQRPIQKFAAAASRCASEATAYGKCVVADYNAVGKDKCLQEFMKLRACCLVRAFVPFS